MGAERSMSFALRSLARQPLFTGPAVLLGGVTAGAALAMIALLRGVLWTPLSLEDPSRLVSLCERHESLGDWCGAATPTVAELARRARSLEGAGAGRSWVFTVDAGGAPFTVDGGLAGPGFFEALGVQPVLGRLPSAEEQGDELGRVVLLGHALWVERFGAESSVVGTSLRLGPDPHTIIGVLPPDFEVPDVPGAELWRPLHFGPEDVDRRSWRGFVGVARLARGVDLAEARDELSAIYRGLDRDFEEIDDTWRLEAIPLLDRVVGGVRGQLRLFASAVALFVAVGCANVLGLSWLRALRTRGAERVRWALGARSGDRLARSAREGAVVGAGAAAVAFGVGWVLLRALLRLAPADIPRLDLVELDPASVVLAVLLAMGLPIAASLGVGAVAGRSTPAESGLRGTASRRTARLRGALIVGESAIALTLVAAAAILLRSFQEYTRWDPGFAVDGVATAQLFASTSVFPDAATVAGAWRSAEERAREIPGVRAAATVSAGPLFGGIETALYATDDDPGATRTVRWYDASPGYLATLGRALVAGRDLSEDDAMGQEPVAVVSQAMARAAFGSADPIGRVVRLPDSDLSLRVVGVVADVPSLVPHEPLQPEIFWSNRQLPRWGAFLVVRTEPGTSPTALADALAALEPDVSVGSLRPLRERLSAALVRPRFSSFLVGAFAVLALLLAVGGLFAVLSVTVAERMRELGIRVALGAGRPRTVVETLLRGVAPAALGALGGVVAYVLVEPALLASMRGVAPAGPWVLAGAAGVSIAAAALAGLPAALRAGAVDPVQLLREAGG